MSGELTTKQIGSQKKLAKFLALLRETGNVNRSARAVGYINPSYVYNMRKQDDEFARQWDEALSLGQKVMTDELEAEADRRAIDGVKKPLLYKGEVVAYEVIYSDALLMFRLRGLRPDMYAPKGGDTNVNVRFGVAVLPMTAPNADAWEKNAIEVHANQKQIVLDPKPGPSKEMITTVRGD
jgi:hypothetical protein